METYPLSVPDSGPAFTEPLSARGAELGYSLTYTEILRWPVLAIRIGFELFVVEGLTHKKQAEIIGALLARHRQRWHNSMTWRTIGLGICLFTQ